MFSINSTKEYPTRISFKDLLMKKSSTAFIPHLIRSKDKISSWLSSWRRKAVLLLIMSDRLELPKLKILNSDNSFSALLRWKLLCWLKNSTTKNQIQENLRTTNLWWLEDQFYWKTSLIDLHLRRKNWSSTIRNLTWRWFQKVTSQIQKKSTKSSKAIKKDC